MLHPESITLDVTPIVITRQCGGYLAINPPDCPVKIGVVGGSEIEARERFQASLEKWIAFIREYGHDEKRSAAMD